MAQTPHCFKRFMSSLPTNFYNLRRNMRSHRDDIEFLLSAGFVHELNGASLLFKRYDAKTGTKIHVWPPSGKRRSFICEIMYSDCIPKQLIASEGSSRYAPTAMLLAVKNLEDRAELMLKCVSRMIYKDRKE